MSNTRQITNLALVGFMGTGKSSVGRLVADQLRFSFIDTDQLIEERAGKSIRDIFAQEGEAAFREHERNMVADLSARKNNVIAAGGGLAVNEENLASLKRHALVVCLWASPETIWERVRNQTHRPLLNDPDPLAKIRQLLIDRQPYYRQADVLMNTAVRSLNEVAQQVIHQFHLMRSTAP